MKNIKRIISIILSVVMVMLCFSGCGGKNTEKQKKNGKSYVTRAEFAGLLGDTFGYGEYEASSNAFSDVSKNDRNYANIQSLAEWGIYEKSGKFGPDENITLEEALDKTVKAVGIEEIKGSGTDIDEGSLMDFYTSNIAEIDTSNPEEKVNYSTLKQIVGYALDYCQSLTIKNKNNTTLANGAKNASSGMKLNSDGCTGQLGSKKDYSVGDIVYFDGNNQDAPQAVKITEVSGDEFTYSEPTIEEVFESVEVAGEYDCRILSARSVSEGTRVASGKELYDEIIMDCAAGNENGGIIPLKNPNVKVEKKSNSIVCTVISGNDDASMNFTVGIKNIKAKVDIDYKALSGLNKVRAQVSYDSVAETKVTGNYSRTIPLAETVVSVFGPVNIRILFEAHIGADGEITVTYTSNTVASVTYNKGNGIKHNIKTKTDMPMEAHASVTAEVSVLLEVRFLTVGITNAQAVTGIAGKADMEADILAGTYSGDILIWVPLEFGVNQKGCMVVDIIKNAKFKKKIWDSETSPYKWKWHFDNSEKAELTDEGEGVEIKDDKGKPIDELKMFDFKPIDFDFINLSSYVMFLDEKESKTIKVSHIPDDYTEKDLVYEVENANICRVSSSGVVTAVGSGSTLVKVSTNDGTTCAYIAVTVSENLTVEGFESL